MHRVSRRRGCVPLAGEDTRVLLRGPAARPARSRLGTARVHIPHEALHSRAVVTVAFEPPEP